MLRLTQDPRLTLRVLGIETDPEIQDGIHLRWAFAPELGFPPAGFQLWVRPARDGKPQGASVGAAAAAVTGAPPPGIVTGGVTVHAADGLPLDIELRCDRRGLALSGRPLVVRFRPDFVKPPGLVREVVLTGITQRGPVVARALHAGRVAACADFAEIATPGSCVQYELTLRADAIDAVEVTGSSALLMTVTYVPLEPDEAEQGWERIGDRICLPVGSSPAYPCPDPGVDPLEVATKRLPDPAQLPPDAPRYDDLVDRLLGRTFDELRAMLEQMLDRASVQPPYLQEERLEPDDKETPSTFTLQPLHQVLLGCTDPYFARVVGLYWVDTTGSGTRDYKVEAEWPQETVDNLTFCWITFGASVEPRPPLAPPTGVTAAAFAGGAGETLDGEPASSQTDVGVSWDRPTACDLTRPETAATAWLVERTDADAPAAGPYALLTVREFEKGARPEVTPVVLTESHDPAAPYPLGLYVDRHPGYGTFHYRVLGRDLFGRTSGPSDPAAVEVRDEVPPGSPLNLAADHIQPDDPDRAGSAALAWANRDTPAGAARRPATVVRWTWPVQRQRQAPDAEEFRLYYRGGPLNAVTGSVTAVTSLGGGRFRVDTTLPPVGPDFPTEPAPADLGVLRNEGEDYPIRTVRGISGGSSFTVTGPVASAPMLGGCAFRFGAGTPARAGVPALPAHPAWRSYRESADWRGLVLDPAPPGVPQPLRVGLDGAVRAPLPPGLTTADVRVTRSSEADPAGGGDHLHYELTLRGLVLATTRDRPRAQGSFGVGAADDSANESRVSAPAGIFAVHRQPPEVPVLSLPEEIWATRADWHGHSYFTFTWTAVRGVGYLVLRVSDATLLAAAGVSMAAHRALTLAQQRQQLRELGSRRANAAVFSAVTPEPVWAAASGALGYLDRLDGTVRNRFVYRLRSIDRAGNLAPWPADPAPTEAGRVAVVVSVPASTPPSPPRWAGSAPTPDGLALHWVPNSEPDLAGYRLYRTDDAEAAADPRAMTPLLGGATPEGAGGLAPVLVRRGTGPTPTIEVDVLPPGDTSPGRLVRYVDADVAGGAPVWYRLVAQDTAGNRSLPSDVLVARPPKREPPDPPQWVAAEPVPGGVDLDWTATEPDLEPLVLRRRAEDPLWRPLSAWLPRGTSTFQDSGAEPGAQYEYRVRVRDRVGHVVDGPVRSVAVPPP